MITVTLAPNSFIINITAGPTTQIHLAIFYILEEEAGTTLGPHHPPTTRWCNMQIHFISVFEWLYSILIYFIRLHSSHPIQSYSILSYPSHFFTTIPSMKLTLRGDQLKIFMSHDKNYVSTMIFKCMTKFCSLIMKENGCNRGS